MDVLLSSDDNYAPLLGVTVYSLLKNNQKDFDFINIHILDGGISEKNKEKLKFICNEFSIKTYLNFIIYDDLENILGIEIKATRALATYSRLFAGSLLNNNIDKILYLDCDALVTDSFKTLWEMELDKYYCAAVLDAGPKYINTFLELPEYNEHFNAGMLLINLKLWRDDNLEKKFLEYIISKNGEVFHNDQGVINVICQGKILKLNPEYNILSPFFEVEYEDVLKFYNITEYYTKDIIENAINNPIFIHLTQFVHGRPWFKNAENHPLRNLFDSYASKTPFKNTIYTEDERHFKGKLLSFTYKYLPYSLICNMFKFYEFIITKTKKGSI